MIIYTMHAHNRWSRTSDRLLELARELELGLDETDYQTPDGSWSTEWTVDDAKLAAIGGLAALWGMAQDSARR